MLECKNKTIGCRAMSTTEQELQYHEEHCEYNNLLVSCVNNSCNERMTVSNLQRHLGVCDKYKCSAVDYGCMFSSTVSEIIQHEYDCRILKKKLGIKHDILDVFNQVISKASSNLRERRERIGIGIPLPSLDIEGNQFSYPNPFYMSDFEYF